MVLGGVFLYMSYYGCDQTQVQRERASRNPDDTNMSLFLNGLLRFPLVLTYCLVGVAIGAYKQSIEGFLTQHRAALLGGAVLVLLVTNYMTQVNWMVHHFDQKHMGGPLRLVDLLAVMSLIWILTDHLRLGPKIGLIEACGRHALTVFATILKSFIEAQDHLQCPISQCD